MLSPKVIINGASDDLIEVGGDISEEFAVYGETEDGVLVAFSNGTVLRVVYAAAGVWRITPVVTGAGSLSIAPAPEGDEENYSDVAALTGVDIKWVVCGNQIAHPAKKKTPVAS